MAFTHGGHLRRLAERAGCRADEILDFSASINPLGPPESLRAVVGRALDDVVHYPDPECDELLQALSAAYGVSPENIVVGNGSRDQLTSILKRLSNTPAG